MSPRSSKLRAAQRKGPKAPSLRDRLARIEAHLTEHVLPSPVMLLGGNKSASVLNSVAVPTIKPRLEALIAYAGQLNSRLDGLSHTISGDGTPAATPNEAPTPYAIPDQLSLLEDLIRRALDRTSSIADRF